MNLTDIRNKTYFLTSTNISSFPDANLIVEANNAYDRVTSLIMQSDGRWEWDDQNNVDLPIATAALVANQQDYTLAITHLEVTRLEVLDNAATPTWHKLEPIDQKDVFNRALITNTSNPYGATPYFYDKIGNSFFLYDAGMNPAPNYSQAASLKLYFKRPPSYFVVSDTTKAPGFNSLYHELIPLWCAYNYAIANGKANASLLMAQIQLKEDALKSDYSVRDKDDHVRLQARPMRWN